MKIRITKEFEFEMAHVLSKHRGLCRNIHGHSYKFALTVVGDVVDTGRDDSSAGMVIDFSDLNKIVNKVVIEKYDHSLVLDKRIADRYLSDSGMNDYKVILLEFEPTCELMLVEFVNEISPLLPQGITLKRAMLRETANSYAEWFSEDN